MRGPGWKCRCKIDDGEQTEAATHSGLNGQRRRRCKMRAPPRSHVGDVCGAHAVRAAERGGDVTSPKRVCCVAALRAVRRGSPGRRRNSRDPPMRRRPGARRRPRTLALLHFECGGAGVRGPRRAGDLDGAAPVPRHPVRQAQRRLEGVRVGLGTAAHSHKECRGARVRRRRCTSPPISQSISDHRRPKRRAKSTCLSCPAVPVVPPRCCLAVALYLPSLPPGPYTPYR